MSTPGELSILLILSQRGSLPHAERDSRFGQVVGGHFQSYTVANGEADEVFAHLAGDMREDFMLVVQRHSEHGARQNRFDNAFQFDRLFCAHNIQTVLRRWNAINKR